MRSLEEINRDNAPSGCQLVSDGRRCTKVAEHDGRCNFIGQKHSARLKRARALIASEAIDTIAIRTSPQVMGMLRNLRDTGYFGGPNPTVETVAEELLRAALRQEKGFAK